MALSETGAQQKYHRISWYPEADINSFTLIPKQWIEKKTAISIFQKRVVMEALMSKNTSYLSLPVGFRLNLNFI